MLLFIIYYNLFDYNESLRLSLYGWPCGPPDGRLYMMEVLTRKVFDFHCIDGHAARHIIYYNLFDCNESLRLSLYRWPCGP